MSKSIPRYDMTDDDPLSNGGGKMELHPIGDYVEYEDHIAAIQSYEARLAEDAKVRAGLVEALADCLAFFNEGQGEFRYTNAYAATVAALAAAKEIK